MCLSYNLPHYAFHCKTIHAARVAQTTYLAPHRGHRISTHPGGGPSSRRTSTVPGTAFISHARHCLRVSCGCGPVQRIGRALVMC